MRRIALLSSLLLASAVSASIDALGQNSLSYLNDLGGTSYGVNIPVENGFINLSNGNLHLEFPMASQPQRGALVLSERLTYDSRIWEFSPFGSHSSYHWWPYNVPGTSTSSAGWQFIKGNELGTFSYSVIGSNTYNCSPGDPSSQITVTQLYISYIEPNGAMHPTSAVETDRESNGGSDSGGGCASSQSISSGSSTDGSGYSIQDDSSGSPLVTDSNGTQVYPQIIDRYGNFYSADGNGNLMDSAGRVPVIITRNGTTTYYDVLSPNGPINNNGARVRYTVTTASISVSTNFGQSDVYDWTGPYLTPVQSIALPDGSQYSFTYDSYGGLTSMTLPTGGTIQYGYSNFVDSSNTANRWLTSHTLGSDPAMTFTPSVVTGCSNYSTGCVEQVKMHKPSGDENVYQLTLNNGAWNTTAKTYAGTAANGQQISQTANTNTYTSPCSGPGCYSGNYLSQSVSTTTLYPGGVQSQTQSSFNSTDGKPSAVKQWDFIASGQSFASSPDRETDYTYTGHDLHQTTVLGQGGQQASQNTYSYTSNATASNITTQHGTANAGGPYLQKVSQWLNTTGSTLDQTMAYDDTGTLLSSTDPNGTTSYGHDGTNVFTTSMTPPVAASGILLMTSATYDTNSGVMLTKTDPNAVTTTYTGFDALSRPTEIDIRDSNSNLVAKTTYSYSVNQAGVYQSMTSSQNTNTQTLFDAYGRQSRVAVFNGQANGNAQWYQVDYCYDASGRMEFQSTRYTGSGFGGPNANPQCSGSGTSYAYDALGRPSSITNADGTMQYAYTGRAVQITDVNGVATINQSDAFVRTTAVCEISSSSLAGESPGSCGTDIAGTGYLTTYTYDFANHITNVGQGVQNRAFQTDSLGRTISVTEPERGNTTYSYSYTGSGNNLGLQVMRNRPKANQPDANTLTQTTTKYDTLGRVVTVSYNDGLTVPKFFYYDSSPSWLQWSTAPQNTLGRLAGTLSNSGGPTSRSQVSYDALGNVSTMWQCAPSICGTSSQEGRPALQFGYDMARNLTYAFDGVTGGISYGRSPAGEVTSVTNQTYANSTNPPNILSSVASSPFGPTSYVLGNGLQIVKTYDALGRQRGNWVCSSSSSPGCPNGVQLYGSDGTFHGARFTDMCDTAINQCQTHGYDDFNRLTSISGGNTSYTYTYDRYGNRMQQTSSPSGPNPSFSFNTGNNRMYGVYYDAAGNITGDGNHSYTYDAEGNVLSIDNGSTARYVYDAMNQRVQVQTSASTNEYLYDPAGHRLSGWLLTGGGAGSGNEGRIWWDGGLLATRNWNGQTYFHHGDWLGTERIRTNYQGQVATTSLSLAFGDGFTQSSSDQYGAAQDNNEFAGQDYDSESLTDHAQFRQYSPAQGRWMSPDPYDGSMDFGNPQSLNRYNYVLNNPLRFTDPTGLDCHGDLSGCGGGGDGCGIVCGGITLGIGALIGEIASLFHHPAFHGSLHPRPGNTQFVTASSVGTPTVVNGTYTLPTYTYGTTFTIPVGTTFTYAGTISQFIASATASGYYLSSEDQFLSDSGISSHKGIAMRNTSRFCSVHVNISRETGPDGYPRIDTHYDLLSPFSQTPSPAIVATVPIHVLVDYLPDVALSSLGIPGTTGNYKCQGVF